MIGVDIGGSHITCIEILDLFQGRINPNIHRAHTALELNKEALLDHWADVINRCVLAKKSVNEVVAIAIPGPFDYIKGIGMRHPNGKFKVLDGVNVKEELSSRLIIPHQLYFVNDATSFGIGEYYYGQKARYDKLIAITLGTGIGSAFVDKGNAMIKGKGVATNGEVYHLPFGDFIADDYFSSRWFVDKGKQFGYCINGVKALIETVDEETKEKIFDEFAANITQFLTPIATQFRTNAIVIGGNIAKAWDYFGRKLTEHFNSLNITVKQSKMGEQLICLGVVRSIYNRIYL